MFVFVIGVAMAQADCLGEGEAFPRCYLLTDSNGPNCATCQLQAIAHCMADPLTFIPNCEGDAYAKYQYSARQNESFCYFPDGTEVIGNRQKGKNNICDELPSRPGRCLASHFSESGFKPSCLEDGDTFGAEQCHKGHCWCVRGDGGPIPVTMFKSTDERRPNCNKHRDLEFECTEDGLFPHPFDCLRYIQCSLGRAWSCICHDTLVFNREAKRCDYAWNVPRCKLTKSTKPSSDFHESVPK